MEAKSKLDIRANLFGDKFAEVKEMEQELEKQFRAAVEKTGAVLWPAVALSFGRT
jgi:hypothetical protein